MTEITPIRRLIIALFHGQHWVVEKLIGRNPNLVHQSLASQIAMYEKDAVLRQLSDEPSISVRLAFNRTPLLHLAFSRYIHSAPHLHQDMLEIANQLLSHGANPNESFDMYQKGDCYLPALYGALGHADNLLLADWLLQNGANPNDDESLYHSTELEHDDGLRLLLDHGALPEGTNALLRAIDFNSHSKVKLLLDHGADPNAAIVEHPSGEPSLMVPALHQAARRMCDGEMISLLIEAGSDPNAKHQGHTAYAYSCMYGNTEAQVTLARAGATSDLTNSEKVLANAATLEFPGSKLLSESSLSSEMRGILVNILHFDDDRLAHAKRLVSCGISPSWTDEMGLPPLHVAGWEGRPEILKWLLELSPNLEHVNDFGGDLLSTIVHGSENCPKRHKREHIRCAQLALNAGVFLSTREIELAGNQEMHLFLDQWAKDHPKSLVSGHKNAQ